MLHRFEDSGLPPALLRVVRELGFVQPTPIQALAIPTLLEGRDVIAQAQTGSGKTAAFALPLLARLELQRRELQGLILCPTRELAAQVGRELRKLGRDLPGLHVVTIAGGQTSAPQIAALRGGAHIAVGTPGRVLDLLQRDELGLTHVKSLVLDEADRMFAMGFREVVESVLAASPNGRQTSFFSATFPEPIEALSRAYQREPLRLVPSDSTAAAVPLIEQRVYFLPEVHKPAALLRLLHDFSEDGTLIFANLKLSVDEINRALRCAGVSAAALHGDLEPAERQRVMACFRNGSVRVLVASDVAARGLDIDGLALVINYDLPLQPELYLHRSGRTGRAGRAGTVLSLAGEHDAQRLSDIDKLLPMPLERSKAELSAPDATSVRLRRAAPMATLHISGGRKAKVRPGDILGALTGDAGGFAAGDIGKIEIHERFSFVAVSRAVAQDALRRLRAGRVKGQRVKVELVRL